MINWINLASNALWILGCAIALAVLSYTSWEVSITKEKMGARLRRPSALSALDLAGFLFCIGLAGTSSFPIARATWLLLALVFMIGLIVGLVRTNRAHSSPPKNN